MARMPRGRIRRGAARRPGRVPQARRAASAAPTGGEGPGIVSWELHRFPWPADAGQRYGPLSPWLAVVNARGPWAVWRHPGAASPPYIPLCLDLLDKGFWRRASNDQRVFALTVWLNAAREDWWGIVWGDPVRLCYAWGLDAATFADRLQWMIGAGLACYLTHVEADAARAWQAYPSRERGEGGKPEGGGGESGKGEGEQEQAESSQDKQGKSKQDKPGPVQIPGPSARANQVPDSGVQGGEQAKTSKQDKQVTAKCQQARDTAQHRQEPANLPKSDHGAAPKGSGPAGRAAGLRREGRPRSVSQGEAVRVGELLGWHDPRAVAFGRKMYAAITGKEAPTDLQAASDAIKGDVGVWVRYWAEHLAGIGDAFDVFVDRCVADVVKKRKVRGIRNLGGLARKVIVPGVLAAMVKGGK